MQLPNWAWFLGCDDVKGLGETQLTYSIPPDHQNQVEELWHVVASLVEQLIVHVRLQRFEAQGEEDHKRQVHTDERNQILEALLQHQDKVSNVLESPQQVDDFDETKDHENDLDGLGRLGLAVLDVVLQVVQQEEENDLQKVKDVPPNEVLELLLVDLSQFDCQEEEDGHHAHLNEKVVPLRAFLDQGKRKGNEVKNEIEEELELPEPFSDLELHVDDSLY